MVWMKFAYLLGWINSRILLIIIFYLVFAPTGLVMRLLRVDLLDRKIEKDKPSYWKTKDDLDSSPLGYEKRF